jgi:hypothetical protein
MPRSRPAKWRVFCIPAAVFTPNFRHKRLHARSRTLQRCVSPRRKWPPVSNKKVAGIIIETLAEAGARRCYGMVGDTL